MSTPLDKVVVTIDRCTQDNWTHYEIDSDLLTPADAWHVTLAQATIDVPPPVVAGASVKVRMNGDTVLTGVLDERVLTVTKGQHELQLSGRDGAGVLLDCSSPFIAARNVTLDQVIAKVLAPMGISPSRVRTSSDVKLLREKFNSEPGDTGWDSLRRSAEANGLWPWFEPDGTLVVGGPRYDLPPVATLTLRADGKGNNLLSLAERRSMADRFSEVTVYGQAQGGGSGAGERDGRNNIKATERDAGVIGFRPKIVVDHEAVNEAIARARATKLISDARVKGYTLTATVRGHRTDDGVLWAPGQRVNVKSEPHGLDGIYFLMARRFTGDKTVGQRTQLTLKEDRVWVLYAHPSKHRHHRLPGRSETK